MKKYLLVIVCALLLIVTGCGKKNQVKCTGSMSEDGMNLTAELVADFDDNDKLIDATAIYDLKDKTLAEQYCSLFKLADNKDKGVSVSCSGTKITIKGYAKMDDDSEEDDEKESLIGKTKEEFKTAMEKESFTCK